MLIKILFVLIITSNLFREYKFERPLDDYGYPVKKIYNCPHSFIDRTARTIFSDQKYNKGMKSENTNKKEDRIENDHLDDNSYYMEHVCSDRNYGSKPKEMDCCFAVIKQNI